MPYSKERSLEIAEVIHAAVAAQIKNEGRIPRTWDSMTQEQRMAEAAWVSATADQMERGEVISYPRTISEAISLSILRAFAGNNIKTPSDETKAENYTSKEMLPASEDNPTGHIIK